MPTDREKLSTSLGPVGFWTFQLDAQPASHARELVCEVEEMGFGAVWIPEGFGSKEAFAHSSILLSGSERIVVATGIANVWARDPMAMSNGSKAIADAWPGRFLLGIGISHEVRASGRGHTYPEHPVQMMRQYLDSMDSLPGPDLPKAPTVLAALGPKMLALSAEKSMGAHPYFVPVEHTAQAREIIGPDKFLAPEQLVVLETDAGKARAIGREFMSHYLGLPNYANNLKRFGFTEEDMTGTYPDRFVDAVTAWGDVDAIRRRVKDHMDAGADHVSLQVLRADASEFPTKELRELASALL